MNRHITASPLTWPEGWVRSVVAENSRFGTWKTPISISKATMFVLDQLRMMSAHKEDVIISSDLKLRLDGLPYSNQRMPDDVGISVWWMKDKTQQVIALDKYDRIADNLYAIGKTLEAMRGIERWGGGEILNRTFTGFVALPDKTNNWRHVLGDAKTIEEVKTIYKKRRSETHPDRGGSEDEFNEVNKAWESAMKELVP